jgi:hypothetical protein
MGMPHILVLLHAFSLGHSHQEEQYFLEDERVVEFKVSLFVNVAY